MSTHNMFLWSNKKKCFSNILLCSAMNVQKFHTLKFITNSRGKVKKQSVCYAT